MKKTTMKPKPTGAGRPALAPDEKLIHGSIRLTQSQWDKVKSNGLPWLRALIDRAKTKPSTEE